MASEASESAQQEKKNSRFYVLIGLGLMFVGFLAIGSPLVTGMAVELFVGCLVAIAGVIRVAFAFRASAIGLGVVEFVLGGLTLVAGALMLAHPLMGLAFMTLLLGGYFLVEGAIQIVQAFQVRSFLRNWGWILFAGLLSAVLGILIWRQWPLSGAWAIGVLVGIKLFFTGWTMIMVGLAARALAGGVPRNTP